MVFRCPCSNPVLLCSKSQVHLHRFENFPSRRGDFCFCDAIEDIGIDRRPPKTYQFRILSFPVPLPQVQPLPEFEKKIVFESYCLENLKKFLMSQNFLKNLPGHFKFYQENNSKKLSFLDSGLRHSRDNKMDLLNLFAIPHVCDI